MGMLCGVCTNCGTIRRHLCKCLFVSNCFSKGGVLKDGIGGMCSFYAKCFSRVHFLSPPMLFHNLFLESSCLPRIALCWLCLEMNIVEFLFGIMLVFMLVVQIAMMYAVDT